MMSHSIVPVSPNNAIPPAAWVDRTEQVFTRVGRWGLVFRLGSAPWAEVDGGQVRFRKSLLEDGTELMHCEAPELGSDRMSARELVSRIHMRAWEYFAGARTGSGDLAKQADVGIALYDAADKRLVYETKKVHRRAIDDVFAEDTSAAAEVRAGSQILGQATSQLATALVSATSVRERSETAREGLLHRQLEAVGDGYKEAFGLMRSAGQDAVIAADVRARAEETEKRLEGERKAGKKFYESDVGATVLTTIAQGLLPAVIQVVGQAMETVATRIQISQVKQAARLEAAQREAQAEGASSSSSSSSSSSPAPKSEPTRRDPNTLADP